MSDTIWRPGRTWLFEAQLRSFDIDGFLATSPAEFPWLARQHAADILPGDQVFVWRAIGDEERDRSGVIAEARVIASSTAMPEDPTALPFWRNAAEAAGEQPRVRLRLVRVAARRQVLQHEWLREDPILRDLAIFRMVQGANYPVQPQQAARLNALWARTGQDWTYAESVAGLWAYAQTHGDEISRLPESPVAAVALKIGRVVPGVYNKVMNFRAIDPRDARAGMSGAGAMDRKVWALFYDEATATLQTAALETEYRRLWEGGGDDLPPDAESRADETFEREVKQLTKLPLTELAAQLDAVGASRRRVPSVSITRTQRFERDPVVTAFAKVRAGFRCEVLDCVHQGFEGNDGQPYCEVHHIEPLAEGGVDTPDNVACICPAHHREAHHGKRAAQIRAVLAGLHRPAG